jgi:multiple sugar transport system ATP-binding protein
MADVRFVEATKIYPGTDVPAVDSLDLHIADGEFMVLVGPSGSGKTTALRMLAGLEEVDAGAVFIGERDVTDLRPKERDVSMVFQNYALYPYLTVGANIGFPLKMAKVKKEERERRVREVAKLLELDEYLERKPNQLSGGQRQRVAMGRAIVRLPQVFLMDEPLSNLDAKLRVQMRADIAALQLDFGITTVYVTHDQAEAMTLGHRVAVLHLGRLQQCDAPNVLYARPANTFVAGFIGSPAMNLCTVPLGANGAVSLGAVDVQLPERLAKSVSRQANGRVVLGLRPEALELAGDGIPAAVEVVEELGADAYVFCSAEIAGEKTRIVARVHARHAPKQGERVRLRPSPDEAHVFDPETGVRLGER